MRTDAEASMEQETALKQSQIYAAHGAGLVVGVPSLAKREARVRAAIPGGEKEPPSESRRRIADDRGLPWHLSPSAAGRSAAVPDSAPHSVQICVLSAITCTCGGVMRKSQSRRLLSSSVAPFNRLRHLIDSLFDYRSQRCGSITALGL